MEAGARDGLRRHRSIGPLRPFQPGPISARPGPVTIRVTDNGPGTAEADLSHLFEPFFRGDPSRSKRTGGLGLGLSICKRIMEAHGGDIAAENSPDRGLSVVVTFPR